MLTMQVSSVSSEESPKVSLFGRRAWLACVRLGCCLLLAATLWHCGPVPDERTDALTSCTDDKAQASPFFGQAVSKEGKFGAAPKGQFYIVATHMKVRMQSKEAMGEFQRVMDNIQKAFPTQQGLLGASLYFSEKCGYAKTLTVWQNYESMMKFVVSEAHSDAMVSANKIASHFRTTHWKGSETPWPITWEGASERLRSVAVQSYD